MRRKSNHFQAYEEVAKKFAKLLGMDPWLINPLFARCGEVNFSDALGHGVRCRAMPTPCWPRSAASTRNTASQEKPFVVVKADTGTYGMGIMTVRDAKELDAT